MPIIDPVNTQQVIQMGAHAEKIQQTLQNQPMVSAQQLEDDRIKAEELKRTEIQDPDETSSSKEVDSNKHRRKNPQQEEEASAEQGDRQPPESPSGQHLDLSV